MTIEFMNHCDIWDMDHKYGQQAANELESMLWTFVKGAKSILEVGSCFGRTMEAMAGVACPGAILRIIDLGELPPEASAPGLDLKPSITKVCQKLVTRGFDVEACFGNSRSGDAIEWARQWERYDFILIDAGHSYEDVSSDWKNYGPMGKCVALHDIARKDLGTGKLWKEIRDRGNCYEIFHPMGIGVVINDVVGGSG